MSKAPEYILDMHHIQSGKWHQYDFKMAGRYGWEYMLETAQYVADTDIKDPLTVTRAASLGVDEKEHLADVRNNGGRIATCPALKMEGSALSVGGYSAVVGAMVKITLVNQTNILRIFVLDKPPENIKEYANSIVARTLKKAVKKAIKTKKNPPPTPGEKRTGAKVLIFLGGTWLAAAMFMAASLDGFMPIGIIWFIISLLFIGWGAYWLKKNPKEKAVKQPAPQPKIEKAPQPAPNPPQPEKPKLWIIINKKRPVIPFIYGDRSIRLYQSQATANSYVAQNFTLDISSAHINRDQLPALGHSWLKYGVKTVKIYASETEFAAHDCAAAKADNIGGVMASIMARMIQNEKANATAEQKVEWQTLQSGLAQLLKTTPLMVPYKYGDEADNDAKEDRQLHMTTAACDRLSKLMSDGEGKSKHPVPQYYAFGRLTGGRYETMWHDGKIIYMGAIDKINQMMEAGGDISMLNEHSGKLMRPMFVDNIQTKIHMIAAFTNMADLRALYPKERVAAFTFSELAGLAKEGDGIVIDPGKLGLNYQMPLSFLAKMEEIMAQPMKFYSLPHEYVEKRQVILTDTGENKIKVIRILRQVTGTDLPTARAMAENTPAMIKRNILLGEAQLIASMLTQAGAKAVIEMEK